MGMLSFSVVVYTLKGGQEAVDMYVPFNNFKYYMELILLSHENFSELLGKPCKSFKQMHDDKADKIMRMVHEYMETVKAGAGAGASTGRRNPSIELDPDGFPILPVTTEWNKVKKTDLETLYRTYLTLHYCTSINYQQHAGDLIILCH
jgi:hypothetical protein